MELTKKKRQNVPYTEKLNLLFAQSAIPVLWDGWRVEICDQVPRLSPTTRPPSAMLQVHDQPSGGHHLRARGRGWPTWSHHSGKWHTSNDGTQVSPPLDPVATSPELDSWFNSSLPSSFSLTSKQSPISPLHYDPCAQMTPNECHIHGPSSQYGLGGGGPGGAQSGGMGHGVSSAAGNHPNHHPASHHHSSSHHHHQSDLHHRHHSSHWLFDWFIHQFNKQLTLAPLISYIYTY